MDSPYSTYDSPYVTADVGDQSITAAGMITLLLFGTLLWVAFYVFLAFCLGKIFKKAGVEQWIAWVPFYNSWKLLQIGGQQGWWVLVALIPFIGAVITSVMMIIAMYQVGLKLGKSGTFVLLAIFLGPVWLAWLAFDDSTWDDSKGAPRVDTPTTPTDPTPPTTPTPPAAPESTPPTVPPTPPVM